jgi:hypothetical protein
MRAEYNHGLQYAQQIEGKRLKRELKHIAFAAAVARKQVIKSWSTQEGQFCLLHETKQLRNRRLQTLRNFGIDPRSRRFGPEEVASALKAIAGPLRANMPIPGYMLHQFMQIFGLPFDSLERTELLKFLGRRGASVSGFHFARVLKEKMRVDSTAWRAPAKIAGGSASPYAAPQFKPANALDLLGREFLEYEVKREQMESAAYRATKLALFTYRQDAPPRPFSKTSRATTIPDEVVAWSETVKTKGTFHPHIAWVQNMRRELWLRANIEWLQQRPKGERERDMGSLASERSAMFKSSTVFTGGGDENYSDDDNHSIGTSGSAVLIPAIKRAGEGASCGPFQTVALKVADPATIVSKGAAVVPEPERRHPTPGPNETRRYSEDWVGTVMSRVRDTVVSQHALPTYTCVRDVNGVWCRFKATHIPETESAVVRAQCLRNGAVSQCRLPLAVLRSALVEMEGGVSGSDSDSEAKTESDITSDTASTVTTASTGTFADNKLGPQSVKFTERTASQIVLSHEFVEAGLPRKYSTVEVVHLCTMACHSVYQLEDGKMHFSFKPCDHEPVRIGIFQSVLEAKAAQRLQNWSRRLKYQRGKVPFKPLPRGWSRRLSNTSKDPYFFNEVTGVSQWEPPAAAAQNILQPGAIVDALDPHKQIRGAMVMAVHLNGAYDLQYHNGGRAAMVGPQNIKSAGKLLADFFLLFHAPSFLPIPSPVLQIIVGCCALLHRLSRSFSLAETQLPKFHCGGACSRG